MEANQRGRDVGRNEGDGVAYSVVQIRCKSTVDMEGPCFTCVIVVIWLSPSVVLFLH